jgi:pimeloyl-ACP methyl ester carboxylesterase
MTDSAGDLKFVTAGGLRFAYLEEGAGPLVLLLHGFPDTPHTWDAVRPALAAAGYRAVSPYTRGYAPTQIPTEEAYDIETLGRDVLALIEALGEKRAIVLGHDWGASATYAAATLGPEQVELLITLSIPHPASLKPSLRLLWTLRHFFVLSRPHAARKIRDANYAYIDKLVQRWAPKWQVPPGETDAVKDAFRQPGSLEAALGYYRALRPSIPAKFRQPIPVPAVSFAGTDDVVSPEVFDPAARFFPKGYKVVRMPGGHFMHREHPERFIKELLAVLASHRR